MPVEISSGRLSAEMYAPEDGIISKRFDRSCFVFNIVLDGKHRFCVPEQLIPDRVTSFGYGLCAEFVWPEQPLMAKAGEKFHKLGVGLLTQKEDNKPFALWSDYETEPGSLQMEVHPDRVVFVQEAPAHMGFTAKIYREVAVHDNNLTVFTTVENTGERDLDLFEYNHNFLAIDNLPVGPGYRLELPFDKNLAAMAGIGFNMETRQPTPGLLLPEGNTLTWTRSMDKLTYHRQTEREDILSMARYSWRLSHDDSPASVRETVSFAPCKYVLWGIEHCVCPEIYAKVNVKPGERQGWSRTWTFDAES